MVLSAYRQVLALPRVAVTIGLMFAARLPMTAMGMLVTLHVVADLDRGYAEAGLVGAATTLAGAAGAPVVGRMIDRHGMRPVVAVCGAVSAGYWLAMPFVPYAVLIGLAIPAGLIAVPAQSLTRQFLTALVPPDRRRTVFSLDMVLGEASFIVGPAAGIAVMTQLGSGPALTGMGCWLALTALALVVLNLPIRGAEEPDPAGVDRPPRRTWLPGGMAGSLLVSVGCMFALIGTEVAVIAVMREQGQTAWTGAVVAAMSVASILGGLIHGGVRRSLSQSWLSVLMCLLLIPVGLFGQPWWLLCLALVPMNLLVTPALAAGAETVTRLAPSAVRGEALGLASAAGGIGLALGNPVVGAAIDGTGPSWGFALAGAGGLAVVCLGAMVTVTTGRRPEVRPARESVEPVG